MKNYTDEELQSMTLEYASVEISNQVYAATGLIERLEFCKANDGSKRIRGNGHHIRQEIAAFAVKLIKYQWVE